MRKFLIGLGLVVLPLGSAYAQTAPEMTIGVRSGIDLAEKARREKDSAYAQDDRQHLRRYLLASITEVKNPDKLVKPVNAKAIADELNKVLRTQGFRPIGPREKPEIVITVLYGRGMLLSPYMDPDLYPAEDWRHGQRAPLNLSNSVPVGLVTHEKFVGLEAANQEVNDEKLAIQVSAMKYPPPSNPKKKPELLWRTIMYADDPAHRDLNLIMPKLLASGAPFFDKHLARENEVKLFTPVPDGHVNVGSPEVVTEKK